MYRTYCTLRQVIQHLRNGLPRPGPTSGHCGVISGGCQDVCSVLHAVRVGSSLFGGHQDVCSVLHTEACVGSSLEEARMCVVYCMLRPDIISGGGRMCVLYCTLRLIISVWRRPGCVFCVLHTEAGDHLCLEEARISVWRRPGCVLCTAH